MSNLKLPRMTYDSLKLGIEQRRTRNPDTPMTLAYATTAEYYYEYGDEFIGIRHHGNAIAQVGPDRLDLTTAGWDSVTTANRLHKILGDFREGVGPMRYSVGVFKGRTAIREWSDTGHKPTIVARFMGPGSWVTFRKLDDGTVVLDREASTRMNWED